MAEEAAQQREDHEGAGVPDVDAPVHGRAARIDPDLSTSAGLELARLAAERVLNANARHGADAIWGLPREGGRTRGCGP